MVVGYGCLVAVGHGCQTALVDHGREAAAAGVLLQELLGTLLGLFTGNGGGTGSHGDEGGQSKQEYPMG